MSKTEVIEWHSFFNGQYKRPNKLEIIIDHIERNKVIYRIAGLTTLLIFTADISHIFASGIDDKASALYHDKLLGFGKWAIIIRGGWTTIQKTMQEDFDGAKKSFFSYLLVYVFLLAFPWALQQIDGAFS